MSITSSQILSHFPNLHLSTKNYPPTFKSSLLSFPTSLRSVKFPTRQNARRRVVLSAASAAGSSSSNADFNPYQVLGVNPIDSFDMIKTTYNRRRKDAERSGDEATVGLLERAYDKIMMEQLTKRKKGQLFGNLKVSKDIKFADKLPVVPWGPRYSKSDAKDMRINLAISAVFTAWIFIKRTAEWKPVQFLAFVYVYRLFEKLKSFEPAVSPTFTEDGQDDGRGLRMGKRLLRSLSLVFGCIALASLAFTGILNLIELTGSYIPVALYNGQELIVTATSAMFLYIMASYFR